MHIRKTKMDDLDQVCQIYKDAQEFMRENGNPGQWGNMHPPRDLIIEDIHAGKSYVCVNESDGEIVAVFYFAIEADPTYAKIDGSWKNDEPYGVIHRIARAPNARGAGTFCMEWCYTQHNNIRIDTHKDNEAMIRSLNKLDFSFCGIIWIESGDERLAFQKGFQKVFNKCKNISLIVDICLFL